MQELKREKKTGRILFTKQMKKEYTILAPMMLPIHFGFIKRIFDRYGYQTELLSTTGTAIVNKGLKYVHNDTCYPALLVIGQLIDALDSGKYDLDKVALLITQTGGGCRASNYIHLLRKALKKAGYENVPVISLNLSGMEKNPGFSLSLKMIRQMLASLIYGDALMLLSNQTRPYERNAGESDRLVHDWTDRLIAEISKGRGLSLKQLSENLDRIVADFTALAVERVPKVKVGVVGEIYIKYSALGNNNLEEFLASQDCEVSVPGLISFMLFKIDNRLEDIKIYGGNPVKYFVAEKLMNYVLKIQDVLIRAIEKSPAFVAPVAYAHTKALAKDIIGYGAKMGEGWLLTAEMMELVEQGYENIVCTQPFGCLPNHICGKGMIRKIASVYPEANIVPIDYDPSATKVNQENRIKLMLAIAKERLMEKNKSEPRPQETKERELVGVGD